MRLPSLTDLRRRYVTEGRALPKDLERALEGDPRAGAASILTAVRKRRRQNRAEGQRLRKMLRFERALWDQGVRYVAGVDEAGMSPLAGPICAAAVILPEGWRQAGVDDSKRLTPEQRDTLATIIERDALSFGIGWASPEDIDRLNVYHAGLLAMRRAVEALSPTPEHLLVDARTVPLPLPQDGIIKGDTKSLSIAAASILAKTRRDTRMAGFDETLPGYNFSQHKGYGVPEHVEAIHRLGPSPIHRRSFPRLQEILSVSERTSR